VLDLEEELHALVVAREQLGWRGRAISVVSRDGLIALKKYRASPQDLADIARLENPS
jgi:hypothetical protein